MLPGETYLGKSESVEHNIFVVYGQGMIQPFLILSERDAREARNTIAEIDAVLTSEDHFKKIVSGLPLTLVNGYRRTLTSQRQDILSTLETYEKAKTGDYKDFINRAGGDIGVLLIVARIIKGLSQKDLARRLGLKEQQVQRYEADRYRSITLSGYRRIAQALGVQLKIQIADKIEPWFASNLISEYSSDEVKKIVRHAKENHWFDVPSQGEEESDQQESLQRLVSDHLIKYGSPALLRTGLNVSDLSNDLLLVAWKARVTKIAESIISTKSPVYKEMDISWLPQLVKLSVEIDGPARARALLLQHGIVLIAEPQIQGLKIDGAAFLVEGTPIIGMTLRRDTIDNFWYTLLHEAAHIILHYRMGLAVGFYDDSDHSSLDGIEKEADEFASNLLIPEDTWKRSPARISKTVEPIEKLAKDLGIHPAIIYGRLQKERNNYTIFNDKLGRGSVRQSLLLQGEKANV